MTNRWFVEERNRFGSWSSVIYEGEKPTEKRVGGYHRKFRREPKLMNVGHSKITLQQAEVVYGEEGKFRNG